MRAIVVRSVLVAALGCVYAVGAPVAASTPAPPPCGPDWSKVRSPSPGTIYSVLLDVAAVASADAWAVGFRAYIDENDQYAVSPIIERWNGSRWKVAARPGAAGQLAGVFALASDDVWAVGHRGLESPDYRPLIKHWDGTAWTTVRSPKVEMGYLTAIGGAGPDDLWAAGTLIGTYETILEHWDGTRWRRVEHPSPQSDYVTLGGLAAGSPDDVWVVGTYLDDQARYAPLALHWDGTSWRQRDPVTVGSLGTSLNDVAVTASGAVWAVGSYATAGGGTQALTQRWTRYGGWTAVLPPDLPGSSSLASIAAGADGIWAVGFQQPPDQPAATLTERWRPGADGWRVKGSPNARGDNYLLGVDQSPAGEMWAVGFHRDGPELTLTEHRCG